MTRDELIAIETRRNGPDPDAEPFSATPLAECRLAGSDGWLANRRSHA